MKRLEAIQIPYQQQFVAHFVAGITGSINKET